MDLQIYRDKVNILHNSDRSKHFRFLAMPSRSLFCKYSNFLYTLRWWLSLP